MNLFNALTQFFSLAELKQLAFDLGIDYENLPSSTKAEFAREFYLHLERANRLDELAQLVEKKRPSVTEITQIGLQSTNTNQTTKTIMEKIITRKWELIAALIVIIGSLIITIMQIRTPTTPVPSATPFFYIITVIDVNGTPIDNANVQLQSSSGSIVNGITDNSGIKILSIPNQILALPGSLIVSKEGYVLERREYTIVQGLPAQIQLRKEP